MRLCKVCKVAELPAFPISTTRCDKCKGQVAPKPISAAPVWQRAILEDLANPFDDNDLAALCKKYNVPLADFYAYKDSMKDFDGELKVIADKHKNFHEMMFWKALIRRVKEGDTRAISIYGEITKVYKPKSTSSVLEGMSEEDKRKRLAQLLKKVESNGLK